MSNGKINDEFVGLKSKIHSMKNVDGKESNTEFNEYKFILFNKKVIRHKMRRIQSKKHKIATYEVNKISLLCFDDKRYIWDNSIHTLACFHKDFKKSRRCLKDSHR